MDKNLEKCLEIIKNLVSDVQGAPYPGDEVKPELYAIWYEHCQRDAVEFLDENFPDKTDIGKTLDKIFK